MKTGEIIQRIQSLYSKGVQSQSTRLRNRHIYNKLLTVRAKLISSEIKKKQKLAQQNYQTIHCIELIEVPRHQCPCIPPIGCNILRSKEKLPKLLSGLNGHIIQSVTTIDGSVKLDEIQVNAVNYLKGNKYTKNKNNFFIFDGYLYLTVFSKMKVVSMTALFEDPAIVKSFKDFCEETSKDVCFDPLNEEFPIDFDLVDTLIELCLQELIQIFQQNTEDLTNNSTDSLIQNSK